MSTLLQLRTEVLNHGFDSTQFTGRVNEYLNNGLRSLVRKINFYAEEAEQTITTIAGTPLYSWPTDFGRGRYLRDTDLQRTLQAVRLRQIDNSPLATGRPASYAVDGPAMLLYPTPDGVYDLALRYWALPPVLVLDTDVPAIPEDYHSSLPYYALQRCYESDDDAEMGQYWAGQWQRAVADMAVDVKFPSTDSPRKVKSMWGDDDVLYVPGWGPW